MSETDENEAAGRTAGEDERYETERSAKAAATDPSATASAERAADQDVEALTKRVETLAEQVERQTELIETQGELIEQLVDELRRGR